MSETISVQARQGSDFWFACVDIAVVRDPVLSPNDKAVFAVICSYVNVGNRSYALKVKTIADKAGCGIRTTQKSIQALADRGVLERVNRFSNGKQLSCEYRIIGHRAECYRQDEEDAGMGANIAGYVENCTHTPADPAPRLLEPESYEIQENIPPAPPKGDGDEASFDLENETEAKSTASWETALHEGILQVYNVALPQHARAEKMTKSRVKQLRARIRDDPARKDLDWWRRYFEGVRRRPWLMGFNPSRWRPNFDWLVAEGNMQKILEGGYLNTSYNGERTEHAAAEQKKYTGSGGKVDARAFLRDSAKN